MLARFGPQYWWPGETPFEVMVGAILTQNTSWTNVEKAIDNLKSANALDARKMNAMAHDELAQLIRPAGYYNVKTRRLQNFLRFFVEEFDADIERMKSLSLSTLRESVLSVSGIGPETADSILLYACGKPIFVIDAYTHRIFARHGIVDDDANYYSLQEQIMGELPEDLQLFNEFHALIVMVGKTYCKAKAPQCDDCPLSGWGTINL